MMGIAVAFALFVAVSEMSAAAIVLGAARAERVAERNREIALAAAYGRTGRDAGERSRLGVYLESAGIGMPARRACALLACAAALAFLLGLGAGGFGAGAFAALLASGAIVLAVGMRRSRRQGRFEAQLCEALPMVAEGIRGGMTFERSVRNATGLMDDPIRSQFRQLAVERSYGVELAEAVENVARRTSSRDMALLSAVVSVNARTGGNMAEVIDSVAKAMQDRQRLRRHISSVTAKGRFSAAIIAAIPVLVFALLMAIAPDYMGVMVSTPIGLVLLAVAVLFVVSGLIIIRRIYRMKVY